METNNNNVENAKGAETKRNLSLPLVFIEEMINDKKLFEIFKKLVADEPNLKSGMLIAIAKRERRAK